MSVFVYVTYRTDIFCCLGECLKNIPAVYMLHFAEDFAESIFQTHSCIYLEEILVSWYNTNREKHI